MYPHTTTRVLTKDKEKQIVRLREKRGWTAEKITRALGLRVHYWRVERQVSIV